MQISNADVISRSAGRSPEILGWLGVIPFAALTLLQVFGPAGLRPAAATALVDYGAIILSFMGGAQWGLAVGDAGDGDGRAKLRYGVSVVPALVGFASTFAPPAPALVVLAVGFAALLAYDLWTIRQHLAPAWYGALRTRLSAAVLACLSVAVLL